MQFEMNRTWSDAVALVRSNFQLLALIAGIFMFLPSLVMIVALPQFSMLTAPGETPEQVGEQLASSSPGFFVLILVLLAISLVGYAAMVALIGPDRPTVGGAIGRAFRALPTLIGSLLIFIIGYFLAALVLGLLVGLLAAVLLSVIGEGGGAILMVIGIAVVIGYLLSRFSLLLPVVVLDGVLNPFKAFVRSWRLTAPASWRIFAFFVLLFIAYFVLALVLVLIMGAVGAITDPAGGPMLLFGIVTGLLGVVVAMLVSGIVVSMHNQLAGISGRAVTEAFE